MNPHQIECYSLSEIGHARTNNEDVFLEMPEHGFFALADGMGGHNAGEVAAKQAVVHLSQCIQKVLSSSEWSLEPLISQIQNAVCSANAWVHSLSQKNTEYKGMGTTLSCFLLRDAKLLYAHVGDSRLYRFRKKLEQLTEDHSLRASLLKSGELKPEEAFSFPQRNVITKAVGTSREVIPDIGVLTTEPNDVYFLCTDGLSDLVKDEEIEAILATHPSIEEKSQKLVRSALDKGGRDNITVVMVKILS